MAIVTDYRLGRQLDHDHTAQLNSIYLKKAGDTATGTIIFPLSVAQGNALVQSINSAVTQITAQHVQMWARLFLTMGG